MTQFYFDKSRESDPHALPDGEVFYLSARRIEIENLEDADGDSLAPGFYWWARFPGCMPDSEPSGPFESESAAIDDARAYGDTDDGSLDDESQP